MEMRAGNGTLGMSYCAPKAGALPDCATPRQICVFNSTAYCRLAATAQRLLFVSQDDAWNPQDIQSTISPLKSYQYSSIANHESVRARVRVDELPDAVFS